MQEDNIQVKIFIGVAVAIFAINLIGIFYGVYADYQYSQVKETIKEEYRQEYENGVEHLIARCQEGVEILSHAIPWFVAKILMGALISFILIFPQKLYELLEVDILKYIYPNDKYQWFIEIIIVIMSIWNIASAFLQISDYVSLLNELNTAIQNLSFDKVLSDISIIQ